MPRLARTIDFASRSLRWLAPLAVICCMGSLCAHVAEAGQPHRFPWACDSGAAVHSGATPTAPETSYPPAAAYQVLSFPVADSAAAAQPLQPMGTRPAYAYGWFGSNPTPQWGRHFGTSRSFTQWTRR